MARTNEAVARLQSQLQATRERLRRKQKKRVEEAARARSREEKLEAEKKRAETKDAEVRDKMALELENLKGKLEAEKKRAERRETELRMLSAGSLEVGRLKWDVKADEIAKGEGLSSPYNMIGGLPFRISCMANDESGLLGIILGCGHKGQNYAALVEATLILASSKTPWSNTFSSLCTPSSTVPGDVVDESWSAILDPSNGFIQNGRLTIEAQIKVIWCCKNDVIDFSSPYPQLSDVTLIVGGKTFHANRMYLAHYSEYFKVLFCSGFAEKNKAEINLEEINADEFKEMLGVIYPQHNKVTAATVTGLLRMAEFFDVPFVIKKCTKFLKKSDDFSLTAKLQLTEEFRLLELQHHLVEEVQSVLVTENLINSADFNKFSLLLRNSIFQKHFQLKG